MKEVICYQLELGKTLPTFRLNTPVVIRAKVKKWEQTLLFIAIHRGSRHWRSKVCQNCSSLIVCLSQQSSNQRLSVLNLSTLLGCHLDVQSLLHQQLLSSAMVQHRGLLPGLGGGSPTYALLQPTSSSPSHRHLGVLSGIFSNACLNLGRHAV